MTSYQLNKQFWAMFKPSSTGPNWYFFQISMLIGGGKLWSDMTSLWLEEWFWAMFEPSTTWSNLDFGQLFM